MKKAIKSMNLVPVGLMVAAGCAVLLMGCAASRAIDPSAQARIAQSPVAAPRAQDFPALESATWKQGTFPSLEALRAMNIGMGKDQVRELLSWPHFSEGLWGVREWNYIFHFRTGRGAEYVTCQYMVRFNEDGLTSGAYWKDAQCADLLKPAPVAAVPTPAPVVVPAAPQRISLAADGLFRFNGGSPDDLQPEGRHKVTALAQSIRGNAKVIRSLVVSGHADRLGSEAHNQALSRQRAETVRDLLVQNGIDPSVIRVMAAGSSQPVIDCPGTRATPELVSCLQPNRRVDIEVTAEN